MGVKVLKPTSNARRGMSVDDFRDVTKKKPEKSLISPIKKQAGRNAQGKITVRHRGGGARRAYRLVDFKMLENIQVTVEAIEYDPNRSARIALVSRNDGEKLYIVAPAGLKIGAKLTFGDEAEVRTGNRKALKDIPVGTIVYNVEMFPGKGGQIARSAGVKAQLMAKEAGMAQVKLPSGEIRLMSENCLASIGIVSNTEHSNIKVGKAGRKRHMGIRPTVRGKAMNPVDHPHGGGEGGTSIGLKNPKTPWGVPALGLKTRNRKKQSNSLVIRTRKKGRR
ncbi:MAG: 50S ribosomal protein L2 [Patescibacteria group bacterium]|nr:50S ribosomal protein L2 [Patescibacteria group bacterium]